MVRVAGQRVGSIDVRALDRSEDVDAAALVAPNRGEHDLVEVAAGGLDQAELEHAVERVGGHPSNEPAEGLPVEGLGAARGEEREVDDELDEAPEELVSPVRSIDVEEPDQVDEGERREEPAEDERCSG